MRRTLALLLQQSRLQWSRKATLQASQQVNPTCALSLHAIMAYGQPVFVMNSEHVSPLCADRHEPALK